MRKHRAAPGWKKQYREEQRESLRIMKIESNRLKVVLQYGITLTDYENMLISQKYSCAICNRHISQFKKRLAIDHCHKRNKVRGLLCSNCNTALGQFKEDTDVMLRAVRYLHNNI